TTTSQTQTTTPAATQTTPAQTTPSQTQTTTPAATQTTTPAAAQTTAPAQTTTSTTPATTQTTPAQTTPSQTQTTTPAAQTSTPARTSTSASSPAQTSRSGMAWYSSLPFIIALIILALLILGLIIFFLSKKIGKSGSSTVSAQAKAAPAPKEKAVDHSKDLASYKSSQNRRTTPYDALDKSKPVEISSTGPLLLNLFVEDQNTNIGKRNIHNLKSGYKLSVGGGKNDDFYIFLVPMPANIGEIRRNGSQLTFTPHKPKYFPEIGSNEVKDCINKTINIVSDKNYDMRFRFEMYEDPLVELNRILNSLNVPG
ncbi:MAG: hypothetical protein FWC21_00370, partial [Treponema sp.]|nr:hypothetical protein [Treponema sp.]